jgi:YD repeat-containing protein
LPGSGGIFTIELQTGFFGRVRFSQKLPGIDGPYVTYWNGDGQLLQIRPPTVGFGGISVFHYSNDGKLKSAVSGSSHTQFVYHPKGWLNQVDHETDFFSLKLTEVHQTLETNGNCLRERRLTFDSKSGFAAAKFLYEYRSSLYLFSISGRIGGQALPSHFIRNSHSLILPNDGLIKDIGQFYIHVHNLNETTISDGVATFARSESTESLHVSGRELYRAHSDTDGCGRLQTVQFAVVRAESESNKVVKYKYDEDGQLEVATIDSTEYRYAYDDNGNLLSSDFTSSSTVSTDRNSFEYTVNNQISRQKGQRFFYEYDTLGRVVVDRHKNRLVYEIGDRLSTVDVSGEKGLRVTYYYDFLGRLCGRKDTAENSTQYFYAFPDRPYLVSHVYNSRAGRLTTLVYDNQNRLIFADVDQRRYYVVSDRIGSPNLFITPTGKIVREINRTPFGYVVSDSEKTLEVPIGFAGGIYDQVLEIIHIQVKHIFATFIFLFQLIFYRHIFNHYHFR